MQPVPEAVAVRAWSSVFGVLLLAIAIGLIIGNPRARRAIIVILGGIGLAILMFFCIGMIAYRGQGVSTAVYVPPVPPAYQVVAPTPPTKSSEPAPPLEIEPIPPSTSVPVEKIPPSRSSVTLAKPADKKPAEKKPPAAVAKTPAAPPQPAPPSSPRSAAAAPHMSESTFQVERQEIEKQWREDQISRRLWHLSSTVGLALILVGSLLAYLKLDLRTGGRHRRNLRLAAGAAILASTALAAYGWNMPWRG